MSVMTMYGYYVEYGFGWDGPECFPMKHMDNLRVALEVAGEIVFNNPEKDEKGNPTVVQIVVYNGETGVEVDRITVMDWRPMKKWVEIEQDEVLKVIAEGLEEG